VAARVVAVVARLAVGGLDDAVAAIGRADARLPRARVLRLDLTRARASVAARQVAVVAALARIDVAVAAGRCADARRAAARPARLDAAAARAAVAAGDAAVVAAFLRLHDAVAALRAAAPVRRVAVVVVVAVAREPVDVVRDATEGAARARDHGV